MHIEEVLRCHMNVLSLFAATPCLHCVWSFSIQGIGLSHSNVGFLINKMENIYMCRCLKRCAICTYGLWFEHL